LAELSMLPAFRICCGDTKHSEFRSIGASKFTRTEARSQRPHSRAFRTRRIMSLPT
jgi:hypothetical protein